MLNVIYPCWHYSKGNPLNVKGLDALLCVAVLYTGLFSLCVIFALLHLWRLRTVLNSPGCSCVKRYIICDNWNPPVLNSFSDSEDEWAKRKRGEYFTFTIYFKGFKVLFIFFFLFFVCRFCISEGLYSSHTRVRYYLYNMLLKRLVAS